MHTSHLSHLSHHAPVHVSHVSSCTSTCLTCLIMHMHMPHLYDSTHDRQIEVLTRYWEVPLVYVVTCCTQKTHHIPCTHHTTFICHTRQIFCTMIVTPTCFNAGFACVKIFQCNDFNKLSEQYDQRQFGYEHYRLYNSNMNTTVNRSTILPQLSTANQ